MYQLVFLALLVSLVVADDDCVPVTNCLPALSIIRSFRGNASQILRTANCGYEGVIPKVKCERVPKIHQMSSRFTDQSNEQIDGNCVRVKDCPVAVQHLELGPRNIQGIEALLVAQCDFENEEYKLKCNTIPTPGVANISERNNVNKKELLPKPELEECGIDGTSPKIFGGNVAEIDDFPWLALIKYKSGAEETFGCHGSLINVKYVMTAAHCLDMEIIKRKELGKIFSVVLGEYDTRRKTDCVQISRFAKDCAFDEDKEYLIASIHIHPRPGPKNELNDIGLIRLNDTVTFTDFIKPICLPVTSLPLIKNETLWIGGWGITEKGTMSDVKLKAKIGYLSKENCLSHVGKAIDDSQICAGSRNGTDTCQGDSGGPLMFRRQVANNYIAFLAGVVSFGPKCGSSAAVYTRVESYMKWILSTIEE